MTPALRWAAMRAILKFHYFEGQSDRTVSTYHNFWRERRAEADSNRGPSAYQPNALPLGQTGSREWNIKRLRIYFLWSRLQDNEKNNFKEESRHQKANSHKFPLRNVNTGNQEKQQKTLEKNTLKKDPQEETEKIHVSTKRARTESVLSAHASYS